MKILAFGNVGAGKTAILNKAKRSIPFEVITIDDHRRKYGDGTKEGELRARKNFFHAIKLEKDQFIECIGVGEVADMLFDLLFGSNEQIICLILLTSKEICKSRLENRNWDIPFPNSLENVFSFMERAEAKIQAGEINKQWSKIKNAIIISKENSKPEDIDLIVDELIGYIKQSNHSLENTNNDIASMLSKGVQDYYGAQYLSYQKKAIEKNDKFLEDRSMITQFISESYLTDNLVDIGAGSCQWFPLLEENINYYYAVEVNENALSSSPVSDKLIRINKNIFDSSFDLKEAIKTNVDHILFSFFLSHFSDSSIEELFNKIEGVNSLIIIDTLWSGKHKEKYTTKELMEVTRRTSDHEQIQLPKRFFEFSDIKKIGSLFGYTITQYQEGNYWFVCALKK